MFLSNFLCFSKKILKELTKNSKTTILISSHDLGHVTEVCERIVVLDKGNIVKDLKTSEETLEELENYVKEENNKYMTWSQVS